MLVSSDEWSGSSIVDAGNAKYPRWSIAEHRVLTARGCPPGLRGLSWPDSAAVSVRRQLRIVQEAATATGSSTFPAPR